MSAQHTPGPLFAVRAKQGGDHAVKDRDNNVIAECFADIRNFGEGAKEEAKANATLYAAAPDMLVALRAVISVADRKTAEFDLAHAAIAKATGSAS